jgi:Pyruvate/2-oxoacid:ferredoxin oxidoreductase delta subunit
MCDNKTPLHYVCTWDEASQLINSHDSFWVCDCGCRERKEGGCHRSRHDVCLMFTHDNAASGSNKHQLTRAEAEAIMVEARTKYLVTRPFLDEPTRTVTEGICFCCDDCCGYFRDPTEVCDKGQFVEQTDMDTCTQCGECDPICRFNARAMSDGELSVFRDACYGCGLCAEICPVDCIEMVLRG